MAWAQGATFAGGLAEWSIMLIVPMFVFSVTDDPFMSGATGGALLGAAFVVRFLLGPVINQIGARRTEWVAAAVQTVCAVGIAVLVGMDEPPILVLIGAMAVLGGAGGANTLAKDTISPKAAMYVGLTPQRGFAFNSAAIITSQAFGPTLGAFASSYVLVGVIGAAALLKVNALIAGFALPRDMETPVPAEPGGYWKSLGSGVAYVWKNRTLRRVNGMLFVVEGLIAPLNGVALPMWAKETGASMGAVATIVSASAFAGIAGALLAMRLGERVQPWKILTVAYVAIVAQLAVLGLGALGVVVPVWQVAVVWILAGISGSAPYAQLQAINGLLPPKELQARTMAVSGSIGRSGSSVGNFVVGASLAQFGLWAMLAGAVLLFVVTQSTAWCQRVRALPVGVRHQEKGTPAVATA
ncbi:hypothetical protein ACQEU8_35845 [Streptomyces sp. CA-250714]|uniref:hypothetical protein n=1 Tax=Streptomyces sp. CA-250714 TaxID=3240060 RepID=UPI003D8E8324